MNSDRPPSWTRYVPSVVLTLVTIAYLAIATRYRPDARAMPLLAGSAALVFLVVDLISLTRSRVGARLTETLSPERDVPRAAHSRSRQARALAWVCGFAALAFIVGVLPGIVLYVIGSMRFFGGRSWLRSTLTALVLVGFVWALFAHVLQTPLYPGWAVQYLLDGAGAPPG